MKKMNYFEKRKYKKRPYLLENTINDYTESDIHNIILSSADKSVFMTEAFFKSKYNYLIFQEVAHLPEFKRYLSHQKCVIEYFEFLNDRFNILDFITSYPQVYENIPLEYIQNNPYFSLEEFLTIILKSNYKKIYEFYKGNHEIASAILMSSEISLQDIVKLDIKDYKEIVKEKIANTFPEIIETYAEIISNLNLSENDILELEEHIIDLSIDKLITYSQDLPQFLKESPRYLTHCILSTYADIEMPDSLCMKVAEYIEKEKITVKYMIPNSFKNSAVILKSLAKNDIYVIDLLYDNVFYTMNSTGITLLPEFKNYMLNEHTPEDVKHFVAIRSLRKDFSLIRYLDDHYSFNTEEQKIIYKLYKESNIEIDALNNKTLMDNIFVLSDLIKEGKIELSSVNIQELLPKNIKTNFYGNYVDVIVTPMEMDSTIESIQKIYGTKIKIKLYLDKPTYKVEDLSSYIKKYPDIEFVPSSNIHYADGIAYIETDFTDFNKAQSEIEETQNTFGTNIQIDFILRGGLKRTTNVRSNINVIKELNKLYPKYRLSTGVNGVSLSLEDIIKDEEFLDMLVAPINNSAMSPYEKYIAVYDIVKNFKKYKFEQNNPQESRDVYCILDNDSMVCVGYSAMLQTLLKRVGIKCQGIGAHTNGEPHQRNLVEIKDEKYGIDAIFFADATWDNYKEFEHELGYNFLNIPLSEYNQKGDIKTPDELQLFFESKTNEEMRPYLKATPVLEFLELFYPSIRVGDLNDEKLEELRNDITRRINYQIPEKQNVQAIMTTFNYKYKNLTSLDKELIKYNFVLIHCMHMLNDNYEFGLIDFKEEYENFIERYQQLILEIPFLESISRIKKQPNVMLRDNITKRVLKEKLLNQLSTYGITSIRFNNDNLIYVYQNENKTISYNELSIEYSLNDIVELIKNQINYTDTIENKMVN